MSDAAQQLAQGFAYHVGVWARRQACDAATLDALQTVAAHVSLATSAGHVCVALGDLPMQAPADVATLRRRLLA